MSAPNFKLVSEYPTDYTIYRPAAGMTLSSFVGMLTDSGITTDAAEIRALNGMSAGDTIDAGKEYVIPTPDSFKSALNGGGNKPPLNVTVSGGNVASFWETYKLPIIIGALFLLIGGAGNGKF